MGAKICGSRILWELNLMEDKILIFKKSCDHSWKTRRVLGEF